jgi:ferritin-like metal-binding protein YciE
MSWIREGIRQLAQTGSDKEKLMPINNPADLFVYELSVMHDAEKRSARLFGEIAGQMGNGNVVQILNEEEQACQQKVQNLDRCFQALNMRPQDVTCAAIDGVRVEFQEFMRQEPSPEIIQLYTIGTIHRLAHFGLGAYKGLLDKAIMMGDAECAQMLQTNAVRNEKRSGSLLRMGHEMTRRMTAPV